MKPRVMAITLVSALIIDASASQQRPVFRAVADSVTIDVGVLDGRRTVTDLAREDFELFDRGVRQTLLEVDRSTLPLDVTLVADLSSSMVDGWTGGLIWARHSDAGTWLRDGLTGIASLLRSEDRLRLVEFASSIRAPAGPKLPSEALGVDAKSRRSSVLDAIALALVQEAEPGRRRLIIALTDGHDTSSVSDAGTRNTVMARSDAVVHVVAIGTRTAASLGGGSGLATRPPSPLRNVRSRGAERAWDQPVGNYDWLFRDIARRTSGRFWLTNEAEDFLREFRQILDETRARYVLRYVPTGVARDGWHDVIVRLRTGLNWDVQARPGYFVSKQPADSPSGRDATARLEVVGGS